MKRYLALFLSLVMILCALPLAIAEDVENPYEDDGIVIYRDADGNVIDLGGMEITVCDWWSSDWHDDEPTTAAGEATYDYRTWLEETYNFKIVQRNATTWNDSPSDFTNFATTGGDENYQLYGVNIDGSDPKAYTAIPGVRTQIIDPLEEIDSLIIIGTNQRNPMIFDPYRLNLNTGEMTMLCENPGDIQGWQTDHDGKLRVAYAIVDGVNTQIRYRETEAEPFRPVLTTNFKEGVSFATFTPDNKLVYAITNLGRDKSALVLMDPATCEELEQLYTNDKYDLRGIWYSDAQKKLQGVSYEGHKGVRRHFFDKATGEMFGRMEKHLRGYEVGISGWNKAEDKYIVYAGGDRTMGAYYLYDVKADTMTKLADLAPWIEEQQMAEMTPVTYTCLLYTSPSPTRP